MWVTDATAGLGGCGAAVGVWGMGRNIVTREGVGQLWKGAGTASFRQMIYGGTRLTIYGPLKQVLASALPVPPGVVNFLSGTSYVLPVSRSADPWGAHTRGWAVSQRRRSRLQAGV